MRGTFSVTWFCGQCRKRLMLEGFRQGGMSRIRSLSWVPLVRTRLSGAGSDCRLRAVHGPRQTYGRCSQQAAWTRLAICPSKVYILQGSYLNCIGETLHNNDALNRWRIDVVKAKIDDDLVCLAVHGIFDPFNRHYSCLVLMWIDQLVKLWGSAKWMSGLVGVEHDQ